MKTNISNETNRAGFEALTMINATPELRMKTNPEPVANKIRPLPTPVVRKTSGRRRSMVEAAIVMFLFTLALYMLLSGYFRATSEVVRGRGFEPLTPTVSRR